ncbi:hypothetical protein DLAC_02354 [Tieghemostelium lacteum]|uniref:SAM domain-containing protein n=1 Tax=Tieghemostelium lacteum TaxID=361077 RepID=A0A152A4R6_TIELA|nr:hypothetical protein DLAC_02354 [Tieghemostelium lacteum]|eukprot:KYR01236.1 hypothetical protein DLAC_02354 [Tieghemostelium lacteum]
MSTDNTQPTSFTDTDIPTLGWNNDSINKWCKVIGVAEEDIKIIGAMGLDGFCLIFKRNNLEAFLDESGVSPSSSAKIHDKFKDQGMQTKHLSLITTPFVSTNIFFYINFIKFKYLFNHNMYTRTAMYVDLK